MRNEGRGRLNRTFVAIAVLVLGAAITGAVLGYLSAEPGQAAGAVVWIIAFSAVILMVGAIAVSVIWMRSIDEAAREAHKAAWFWGGSTGMALGGAVIVLSLLPGAETLDLPAFWAGRTDPAAYAAAGASAMLLLMLVGYTIVWAWWWLARR